MLWEGVIEGVWSAGLWHRSLWVCILSAICPIWSKGLENNSSLGKVTTLVSFKFSEVKIQEHNLLRTLSEFQGLIMPLVFRVRKQRNSIVSEQSITTCNLTSTSNISLIIMNCRHNILRITWSMRRVNSPLFNQHISLILLILTYQHLGTQKPH